MTKRDRCQEGACEEGCDQREQRSVRPVGSVLRSGSDPHSRLGELPLALAAFKAGFVPKRQLAKDVVNAVIFVVAGASDERSAALRERILDAVKGVPVRTSSRFGDEFIPTLPETVMPEAQAELDRMKAEGRDRIIVSASPIEIVQELADKLGLEGAVGAGQKSEQQVHRQAAGPFSATAKARCWQSSSSPKSAATT